MFDGLPAYTSSDSLKDAPFDFTKPTGITPPPDVIPSTRANVVTRRSYSRPLDETETRFETWSGKNSIVARCIGHQRWLWERAQGFPLTDEQEEELSELQQLLERREGMLSGRTLWMGGTETVKKRESSNFNCSFSRLSTIHDVVDHFWLLLQGVGVGSIAMPGTLNGFAKPVEDVITIPSERTKEQWEAGERGVEHNVEWVSFDNGKRTWNLRIGDSAAAWAKALGKIMAMKHPVDRIVLDYREIRAEGIRLKGYGWISSGYIDLSLALEAICWIMSKAHNRLLNRIEMLDIENWMGTTLSSRRSAEIVMCPYGDEYWEEFALAKRNHWEGNSQREQSNNSLTFEDRPSKAELYGLFYLMQLGGGSEPGFINMREARRRAPWVAGFNPCGEIALGDKGLCNLSEVVLNKFNGRFQELLRAMYVIGRANYRQTCVDLHDGVLQDAWHELNQFLRLCGVGVTGIVCWEYEKDEQRIEQIKAAAIAGAHSMADELVLPRAKAVTTCKPSGTMSKVADTTEGCHKPLGKYIFNNINFGIHNPLLPKLKAANYRIFENPSNPSSMVVTFPVAYNQVEFDKVDVISEITRAPTLLSHIIEALPGRYKDRLLSTYPKLNRVQSEVRTVDVNRETAIEQLERYKRWMKHYVDYNCSITISYSPEEVPEIVDWIYANWDNYVGVSFLYRNDPTKTAEDLGFKYLPQAVVSKEEYDEYVATLLPVDLGNNGTMDDIVDDVCSTGACPIR